MSSYSGTCLYLSKVHVNRKEIVVALPDLIILTVYRVDSLCYMWSVSSGDHTSVDTQLININYKRHFV